MKTSASGASDAMSNLCAGTDPTYSAQQAGTGRSPRRDGHSLEAPLSAAFYHRVFGIFPEPSFKLVDTLQVEELVEDFVFGVPPMQRALRNMSTEKLIYAHLVPKRLLRATS